MHHKTCHSKMNSLARWICALGAGHTISPDSSRIEGVKWYSGTSGRGFFALGVALDTEDALRFISI